MEKGLDRVGPEKGLHSRRGDDTKVDSRMWRTIDDWIDRLVVVVMVVVVVEEEVENCDDRKEDEILIMTVGAPGGLGWIESD